jgi:hypothetical protein
MLAAQRFIFHVGRRATMGIDNQTPLPHRLGRSKLLRHDIATAWGSKVGEQGLQSTSPRHIIADETIWQNESM